jgi:2,3-bisphosphoglycerate-independent phosphoglycerate mutase
MSFWNRCCWKKKGVIEPGDVVLFFNFRTDRPRELVEVLSQKDHPDHNMHIMDLFFLTFTRYDDRFQNIRVLYEKEDLSNTLGEIISREGGRQIRIAETEKYPHVTFFFNGGREAVFDGESRILIPSPKVATYDLQPEMSAPEVTDAILEAIQADAPDFICLNFANPDMVGHTGSVPAAIRAVETVDLCLSRIIPNALHLGYNILILADHGNADYMINADGTPNTAHTMNPVPLIFVSKNAGQYQVLPGKLGDIAPTILHLMNLPVPAEMTGDILVNKSLISD